ncbi:ATP-dependent metallopeptidase FtsH/Yme1/Tma family protein [Caldimonas tepidiphila]|uniref:ATP-dependent metallopeptidase FtsH/Yme1/Tma family protein n=1 Tax=Caldimonas tepidiphila TaxID=2315841 RepID=UPI000E5A4DB9|nr:AAA family ATPase [Caldimonas tepidiphila]
MSLLKNALKNRFVLFSLAALLLGAIGTGTWMLKQRIADEADSRKSPTALLYESAPEQWLNNPRDISQFESLLERSQLDSVAVNGRSVLYTDRQGGRYSSQITGCKSDEPCASPLLAKLGEASVQQGFALTHVEIDARTDAQKVSDGLELAGLILLRVGFVGLVLWVVWYFVCQSRSTRIKLAEKPETRFDDVIGADEAKQALRRVTAFLKDPGRYVDVGAVPPRGVLLEGPPGTGKTLLARALAGECGANFIAVDGSYFTSALYGAGVNKVRELFEEARRNAPCVLFIDEVDGLGRRHSGRETSGGEGEQNRIINRILVEMDGFSKLENVVVLAATNHADNVDEALRRPGRFDMTVRMALPTVHERERLFALYVGKVKASSGLDLSTLARTASGMSPADIANVVNKAASSAAEAGVRQVDQEHLFQAVEAHQLGGEVSSVKNILTAETRERIAVHEAGHALVGHVLNAGSVERVSIEPRGGALGVTYMTRHTEEPLYGEAELHSRLAMMLAGREAELMCFGNTCSGASDDLKRASELATSMVGSYGFSETFGLLSLAGVPKELIGPDIQHALLQEARRILEEAQASCRKVLLQRRKSLEALRDALLVDETVSGEPLMELLGDPAGTQLHVA